MSKDYIELNHMAETCDEQLPIITTIGDGDRGHALHIISPVGHAEHDSLPVLSPIGRGPKGDGITAEVLDTGIAGEFKFVIKNDNGDVIFTSANLAAGDFDFTQDTIPTQAGEDAIGHFTKTVAGTTEQYQVLIPPGEEGTYIFVADAAQLENGRYTSPVSSLQPDTRPARIGDAVIFTAMDLSSGSDGLSIGFIDSIVDDTAFFNPSYFYPAVADNQEQIDSIYAAIGLVSQNVDTINGKIPSTATSSNKLADQAFVNSSINSMTARRLYPDAYEGYWNTRAQLLAATTFYTSNGTVTTPTTNDYTIVMSDESAPPPYTNGQTRWRVPLGATNFAFDYGINETPFTAAQQAAIDSGITDSIVEDINNKADIPVNGSTTTNITGVFYRLPPGGGARVPNPISIARGSLSTAPGDIDDGRLALYGQDGALPVRPTPEFDTEAASKIYVDNAIASGGGVGDKPFYDSFQPIGYGLFSDNSTQTIASGWAGRLATPSMKPEFSNAYINSTIATMNVSFTFQQFFATNTNLPYLYAMPVGLPRTFVYDGRTYTICNNVGTKKPSGDGTLSIGTAELFDEFDYGANGSWYSGAIIAIGALYPIRIVIIKNQMGVLNSPTAGQTLAKSRTFFQVTNLPIMYKV